MAALPRWLREAEQTVRPNPEETGPPPLATPNFINKMISYYWLPYNIIFFKINNVLIPEAEEVGGIA